MRTYEVARQPEQRCLLCTASAYVTNAGRVRVEVGFCPGHRPPPEDEARD